MKNFASAAEESAELLLVLSLLSGRPVSLPLAAMDLVKFLLEITDGSECRAEGGVLRFLPGTLAGGRRSILVGSIGRLVAPLAVLGPFMREPLSLRLEGITNDEQSVDMLKTAYSHVFRVFNVPGASISILRRGFAPLGGGCVQIQMGVLRRLECVVLRETEMFDRTRGLVVTSRIGTDFTQRMVSTVRAEMESLGGVRVHSILGNRNDCGPSPGYECSVYVEGRSGIFYHTLGNNEPPERMARECCRGLLEEMGRGGVYDRKLLSAVLPLMALASGVSYLNIGEMRGGAEQILDLLKRFLGIEYYLVRGDDGVTVKIVGCGYVNIARPL